MVNYSRASAPQVELVDFYPEGETMNVVMECAAVAAASLCYPLMPIAARYMELGDLCRAIDGQISKCAHFPNEQVSLPAPSFSCTSFLSISGTLSSLPLQAFLYLYQVCEALAYTHSMGIIHRCARCAACDAPSLGLLQGTSSPRTFS